MYLCVEKDGAAGEFGTTQARISELVNGKIQAFSIDAIINVLNRAGLGVGVDVRPREEAYCDLPFPLLRRLFLRSLDL